MLLGTLETGGWACDASMNLEDLQILFIQEGDLLLRLVVLRVHNWECPISRFSVDIMTMVDTWLSCDFFIFMGIYLNNFVLDLFCTFKMVSKPLSLNIFQNIRHKHFSIVLLWSAEHPK